MRWTTKRKQQRQKQANQHFFFFLYQNQTGMRVASKAALHISFVAEADSGGCPSYATNTPGCSLLKLCVCPPLVVVNPCETPFWAVCVVEVDPEEVEVAEAEEDTEPTQKKWKNFKLRRTRRFFSNFFLFSYLTCSRNARLSCSLTRLCLPCLHLGASRSRTLWNKASRGGRK